MPKITPFLWFDTQAEEAAMLYTTVLPNSKIHDVARYGPAGPRPEGTVMTVRFELDGQEVVALNGGPEHTFSEAVSFVVNCRDQDEVDHYWNSLSEGGEEGPCGWLKDRYGLSWQIAWRRSREPVRIPRIAAASGAVPDRPGGWDPAWRRPRRPQDAGRKLPANTSK